MPLSRCQRRPLEKISPGDLILGAIAPAADPELRRPCKILAFLNQSLSGGFRCCEAKEACVATTAEDVGRNHPTHAKQPTSASGDSTHTPEADGYFYTVLPEAFQPNEDFDPPTKLAFFQLEPNDFFGRILPFVRFNSDFVRREICAEANNTPGTRFFSDRDWLDAFISPTDTLTALPSSQQLMAHTNRGYCTADLRCRSGSLCTSHPIWQIPAIAFRLCPGMEEDSGGRTCPFCIGLDLAMAFDEANRLAQKEKLSVFDEQVLLAKTNMHTQLHYARISLR